jgi:hypothetical protein
MKQDDAFFLFLFVFSSDTVVFFVCLVCLSFSNVIFERVLSHNKFLETEVIGNGE